MPTSIIIVTYNGAKWIVPALKSCIDAESVTEVIVVDNNSTDDTCNLITTQFPTVKLLRQNENKGFGVANNIGISEALKLPIAGVFLLNQDAKITPTCISSIEKAFQEEPNQGIISPIHLNYDGTELHRGFAGYLAANGRPILTDGLQGKLKNIYDFPNSPAALWWLPKSTLRDVGGFDPLFFLYCEDADLARRVAINGKRLTICTSALAMHDDSPWPKSPRAQRHLLLSQQLINLKYSQNFSIDFLKAFMRLFRRSLGTAFRSDLNLSLELSKNIPILLTKYPQLVGMQKYKDVEKAYRHLNGRSAL